MENPERGWWRRKTTRASTVWEHWIKNLVGHFDRAPGAVVISHHDTISFVFDQLVLLRLKKANIKLVSSNVPTTLAQAFHAHEEDLYGFTGLHRVEAAYVLNEFETRPDWIGIVAREKRTVLWQFELDAGGEEVIRQLPIAPLSPAPDVAPAADRLVQAKISVGGANKKNDEEQG